MKQSREHWSNKEGSITTDTQKIYTKKLFTKLAPRYRFFTTMLSFGRDMSWKRSLISKLPVYPNPTCLDIGCGTGDLTFLLANKYQQSSIIGIDITRSMLDQARERNSASYVTFQHLDMCELPFESNSVDIVTSGYALHYAHSLSDALSEIHRVLKQGGIFAFLEFSKHSSNILHSIHYYLLYAWSGLWSFIVHGDPALYISAATKMNQFPSREELHTLLQKAHFSILHTQRFMAGMVEITLCKKL